MFILLKRIKLLLTYGPEIDQILHEKQKARKFEAQRYQLNLCKKHQQRSPGTEYSTKNCHFCKLLKETEKLRKESEG